MFRLRRNQFALYAAILVFISLRQSLCAQAQNDTRAVSGQPSVQDVPGLNRRAEQVPLLKTESRLVVLDVIVTDDKGRPMRGLTQSDFVLREDGEPQRLKGFEEHTTADPNDSAERLATAKLPPNTFSDDMPTVQESSYILIVLEGDTMRVREDLLVYMKTVAVGTRIAIIELDGLGLHMIQGFSSDPSELRQAVDGKRIYPKFTPKVTAEMFREAVQKMSLYLAGFPGRKSVIWFGPSSAPTDLSRREMFSDEMGFLDEMQKTTDVLKLNQIAVYGMIPGIGGSLLDEMQRSTVVLAPNQMIANQMPANQMNQAILYGSADLGEAAMQQQMRRSGGDLIYNTNGIEEEIQKIAQGAWSYYTLSYSPSNNVFDSAARKLEVTIPGRKVDLQYRHSYYALNDEAKRREHLKAHQATLPAPPPGKGSSATTSIDTAMLLGAPAPRDVLFTAHLDPSKKALKASSTTLLSDSNFLAVGYRKKWFREYRIHYRVDASSLQSLRTADGTYHVRLDFIAVVYDNLGNPVNSLVDRTSEDVTSLFYSEMLRNGIELTQTIAIPDKISPTNGFLLLRLGVHDVLADKSGALEIAVDRIKLGLPP